MYSCWTNQSHFMSAGKLYEEKSHIDRPFFPPLSHFKVILEKHLFQFLGQVYPERTEQTNIKIVFSEWNKTANKAKTRTMSKFDKVKGRFSVNDVQMRTGNYIWRKTWLFTVRLIARWKKNKKNAHIGWFCLTPSSRDFVTQHSCLKCLASWSISMPPVLSAAICKF